MDPPDSTVATLIGAAIGAFAALGAGIVTELWRDRRSETGAARLIYAELRDNALRIAALRDLGIWPKAQVIRKAWDTQAEALARGKRGRRVMQSAQYAYVTSDLVVQLVDVTGTAPGYY